ncbi:MAG TPA: DUF4276 family protein [Desulfobacteria bacterium]|nr:DUF4276 family protein [Desulfobacteria bacterium]
MIGFIVEGPSDEKVVEEICRKLQVQPKIKQMRKAINPRKAKVFAEFLLGLDCEKVIILQDSHCSDPAKIEGNLKGRLIEESLRDKMDREVKICVVVHAIESWLLADEEAIGDYLRSKVRGIHNPENECKPEEVLDEIFKRHDEQKYLKGGEAPREIAKRLSLDRVIEKCPSFIKFKTFIE